MNAYTFTLLKDLKLYKKSKSKSKKKTETYYNHKTLILKAYMCVCDYMSVVTVRMSYEWNHARMSTLLVTD